MLAETQDHRTAAELLLEGEHVPRSVPIGPRPGLGTRPLAEPSLRIEDAARGAVLEREAAVGLGAHRAGAAQHRRAAPRRAVIARGEADQGAALGFDYIDPSEAVAPDRLRGRDRVRPP